MISSFELLIYDCLVKRLRSQDYFLFNVATIEVITTKDIYYGIYLIILHLHI